MNFNLPVAIVVLVCALMMGANSANAEYPFAFKDASEEAGLASHVAGIRGHGAAWGDVDGDGWLDLYVQTFHEQGSKANQFFRNDHGRFQPDDQKSLGVSVRGTGTVFADLDNDGDLDLYLGSMPQAKNNLAGCQLLRNDGGGKFTNISADNGACPTAFGGRSATVLDYDGDGLLDLLVGEEPVVGYNGSKTRSSRLFRNLGSLRFEDVSKNVGLPELAGLGVAAADVNNDGWPDFVLAATTGNHLLLNNGKGAFRESATARKVFAWPQAKGDNMVCGVAIADVNRDGLLDVVLAQHFKTPWKEPVRNRLYLNRGIRDGEPEFEDVTERVGLAPLSLKSPHVEIQDFDNDGWPDIYVSTVKFKEGKPYPVIFRNQGIKEGLPQFRDDAWGVNDFPNDEDRAVQGTGPFFEKVIKDRKIIYTAPGPSGDFDNDGRLDLFLANWWLESRSLLLKNETAGGNWLRVRLDGVPGVNRMGIGCRVHVYAAGKLGDKSALLGCRDLATGYGYASGQPAYAHFGLGSAEKVDIELILPHGKGKIVRKDVAANQLLTVKE